MIMESPSYTFALTPTRIPVDGGEVEGLTHDALVKQIFHPYRSLCARKGIQAKEVIIYDEDITGALCEYISVNSIRRIVLGASTRRAITRAFKVADIPTSVGKSAPASCSVFSVSDKGKTHLIKSTCGFAPHFAPNSSISRKGYVSGPIGPIRCVSGPVSPIAATKSTSHDGFLPDYSSGSLSGHGKTRTTWWTATFDILFPEPTQSCETESGESSREHLQMPAVKDTSSPHSSVNSSESCNGYPCEKHSGDKNPKLDNTGYGNDEFGLMNPAKKFPARKINALVQSTRFLNLRGRDLNALVPLSSEVTDYSEEQSSLSDVTHEFVDQTTILNESRSFTTSQPAEVDEELQRMKQELMQVTEKFGTGCQEKANDIAQCKSEVKKLEEAKRIHDAALAMVERESQKYKAAIEMAQKAQRLAELESEKRRRAELMLKHESEEKQKAMDALTRFGPQYRRYSIDEIRAATHGFSDDDKIAEGGYGPVYKATLDHTRVAVKVLRTDGSEGQKQFQREVEVLSDMRHPNIVILLGVCPEIKCLVYEYMDNGSLESCLFRKNGTPPLPWRIRFQIAAEIATGLNFLHQTKPQPIVHRDLKPDNILLDKNYVSKISDVGLCRLVPPVNDSVTQYQMTAAAGTFCYIDPEYQQTGMLGTKSDIYSLGIILLQILTAKPPIGLAHNVERAIAVGRFQDVLDPTVEDWPVDDALLLAKLALQCCELRNRDRPNLHSVILPELERLREL